MDVKRIMKKISFSEVKKQFEIWKDKIKKYIDLPPKIYEKLKEKKEMTDEEIAKEFNINIRVAQILIGVLISRYKDVRWKLLKDGRVKVKIVE